MIFSEFKSILTAMMFELKYQMWKQKTFEQGRKLNHSLKNRPLGKMTSKHIVCFPAFDFTPAVKVWASPKTTFETNYAMVAHCFERKKLGETSFVRILKAKDGFAPRPQSTVNKQLKGDPKNLFRQLKVWRALLRTKVQCWKNLLSRISIHMFFFAPRKSIEQMNSKFRHSQKWLLETRNCSASNAG